jgi:hypothetical protein
MAAMGQALTPTCCSSACVAAVGQPANACRNAAAGAATSAADSPAAARAPHQAQLRMNPQYHRRHIPTYSKVPPFDVHISDSRRLAAPGQLSPGVQLRSCFQCAAHPRWPLSRSSVPGWRFALTIALAPGLRRHEGRAGEYFAKCHEMPWRRHRG